MKYSFGRTINLIILIFTLTVWVCGADGAEITFDLTEQDCGGKTVFAASGEAALSASADGVHSEEIRWDSDPAHLYPRMQGKKLYSGWMEGGYWLIEFSGKGMESLSFSAVMYSSGKGPADFELLYSFDNSDYIKIDDSERKLTKNPAKVYDSFPLPETLCGQEKIYLKIRIASDKSVSGGIITGVKDGSTYINNISIAYNGEKEPDSPQPSEPEKYIPYPQRENTEIKNYSLPTGKYKFTVER